MASKPQTAAEWRAHAEVLHGRGLEVLDHIENLKNTPAEVATVHVGRAQMYFLAARSAATLARGARPGQVPGP